MLSIEELRPMAAAMTVSRFREQLGPFALIQQPPIEDTQRLGISFAGRQTLTAAPEDISRSALSLLFQIERLQIATLPPLRGDERFIVGRGADCDIVLDAASVSKRHAELRWLHAEGKCELQDLGSTNGTFVNGANVARRLVRLADSDILSFGEAPFWYLLTETLHARLTSPENENLRSRSG